MLSVQKGDLDAFESIVRHYQAPVINFVGRYFSDRARSEDVAQEAFFRVYKARKRYEPTAKFRTWLFTIVSRLCLNEIRNHQRRSRFFTTSSSSATDSDSGRDLLGQVPDEHMETPLETVERQELEETLQDCIDALPHNQRAAILMLRGQETSYQDIADVLEVTVPAVKSLVNRARETIRQALGSYRAGKDSSSTALLE